MAGNRLQLAALVVASVALAASQVEPAAGQEIAFSAAHKVTLDTMEELRTKFESVKDAKTATAVAKELPGITDRFVAESKVATGLYLGLSEEGKRDAQKAIQEDLIAKIRAGKLNPGNDLVSLMVQLSKGPQRPILEKQLVQLRDTLLEQRSIYVPVTARERIAKSLGSKGSPLPK